MINKSGNKRGKLEISYDEDDESYFYLITTKANRKIMQEGYGTPGAAKGAGTATARAYEIDLSPMQRVSKKLNARIRHR